MNERIKELMNQAMESTGVEGLGGSYMELNPEKFAELIVRECVKVLTQHGAYFSGDGEPYHYAASLIEEHFGVE